MEKQLSPNLLAALNELCNPLGQAITKEHGEALTSLGFAKSSLNAGGYVATDKGRKHLKAGK